MPSSPAQAGTSVAAATTLAVDTVDTADTATDDADVDTVEAEPAATEVETSAFTLTPPAGWIRDAQEVDHDGYVESRWHLPGAPEVYVLIDHTVDFDGTPEDGARSVRKMTSRNADYAELAFEPAAVAGLGKLAVGVRARPRSQGRLVPDRLRHRLRPARGRARGPLERAETTFADVSDSLVLPC